MSKIDYEITVDVRNLSVEERKRVQDAYFKLGIFWDGAEGEYKHLQLGDYYTNKRYEGHIVDYLMWGAPEKLYTHTPEQLYALAGMNDIPECMEPFDLERALAGDPVVTRQGQDASQIALFNVQEGFYSLAAVVGGKSISLFTKEGRYTLREDHPHPHDLFMLKRTHKVNGFEVPMPLKIAPEKGDWFWLEILSSEGFCVEIVWGGGAFSKMVMERGVAHSTEEGAIANAKARLGIDPYS